MNRNKLLTLAVFGPLLGAIALSFAFAGEKAEAPPQPPANFKGKIELDIRNSVPDWGPYTPKKAPEGAPNILFMLYDDTG